MLQITLRYRSHSEKFIGMQLNRNTAMHC